MAKPCNADAALRGYLLPEEAREKLEQIRDQLFLMACVTFASTQREEDEALEIRRSMLAQCFEGFGLQIDEVLAAMMWLAGDMHKVVRKH